MEKKRVNLRDWREKNTSEVRRKTSKKKKNELIARRKHVETFGAKQGRKEGKGGSGGIRHRGEEASLRKLIWLKGGL